MLDCDSSDACGEELVHARVKLDRVAAGPDAHGVAWLEAEPRCVLGRELDFRGGPLELKLRNALDGWAREERPVGDQAKARALGSALRRRRSSKAIDWVPVGARRALADRGVVDAAVAALRELGEDEWPMRRDGDAEALCELRDPRELVRARCDDGAAKALEPAFEVHICRRARGSSCRRGRSAQPLSGERNIDREHLRRALGQGADVRVRRRLVARHDQQLDRLRVGLPLRRLRSPGRRRRVPALPDSRTHLRRVSRNRARRRARRSSHRPGRPAPTRSGSPARSPESVSQGRRRGRTGRRGRLRRSESRRRRRPPVVPRAARGRRSERARRPGRRRGRRSTLRRGLRRAARKASRAGLTSRATAQCAPAPCRSSFP